MIERLGERERGINNSVMNILILKHLGRDVIQRVSCLNFELGEDLVCIINLGVINKSHEVK